MSRELPEKYALIKWKDVAKKTGLKDPGLKEIAVFSKSKFQWVEEYHQVRVNQLRRKGIPVVDKTEERGPLGEKPTTTFRMGRVRL